MCYLGNMGVEWIPETEHTRLTGEENAPAGTQTWDLWVQESDTLPLSNPHCPVDFCFLFPAKLCAFDVGKTDKVDSVFKTETMWNYFWVFR